MQAKMSPGTRFVNGPHIGKISLDPDKVIRSEMEKAGPCLSLMGAIFLDLKTYAMSSFV